MKRIIYIFGILFVALTTLTSCSLFEAEKSKPTSYYLTTKGDLVVVYADGNKENLGSWGDEIIKSLKDVSVTENGYYIINGVETEISVNDIVSYYLDSNDHLIIKYRDNSKKDLGEFNGSLIKSFDSVTTKDGYYIINGIKTDIKVKTPISYSLDENNHLIVTYSDNSKEDVADFSSYVTTIKSVSISSDGYLIINGEKTSVSVYENYNVYFNTGCSQTVETQSVRYGNKVTKPTLTRSGYTLTGWTYNNESWNFNTDTVTSDMTLKAVWEANTYTITFVTSLGTAPSPMTVTFDGSYTLPILKDVDGNTFVGWYDGDTKVSPTKWNIPKNVTLTAKWEDAETVLDSNPDVVSISDLSINGKNNLTSVTETANYDVSYSVNNANGSLVFKFYYEVTNGPATEGNAVRIHFLVNDDKWSTDNCIWLRGDYSFITLYNKEKKEYRFTSTTALSEGLYEVEFGRIAYLKNGNPNGEYYVYYKVNGVLINSGDCPYDLKKLNGKMFFNFSSGTDNNIYDISSMPGYESPNRVSIGDLKSNGKSVGDAVILSDHQTLTYDATASNKSVVYSFFYEVKNQSSMNCQFHMNSTWLGDTHGGIVWLRNDKNYLSKVGTNSYLSCSPLSKEGFYKIEIGKLYITSGTNSGKYYIYLSVDGTKVLEYIIDNMPLSDALFITGKNGDVLHDIDYMPVSIQTKPYANEEVGIEFEATLNKDLINKQGISEVGFIIYPSDKPSETKKVVASLIDNGQNYVVKAQVLPINENNATQNYSAKFYYVKQNSSGSNVIHYGGAISASLYSLLDDLSGLSTDEINMINSIKEKLMIVFIDEDTCEVIGANKSGNFDSTSITLTGSKNTYSSYIVNNKVVYYDDVIMIGYHTYKVQPNGNKIILVKQTTKTIYGGSEHFVELNSGHDPKMTAENLSPMTTELGLSSIRLDIVFSKLFTVMPNNELMVNSSYVTQIQGVLDELKKNGGITTFLGVCWTVQPNEYPITWNGKPWAEKTCPDPFTDTNTYIKWLEINAKALSMTAELFPDIMAYEPWNEPEIMREFDGELSRSDGTNYSAEEKALILTDLMYYYKKALNSVNPDIILTTPSICSYGKSKYQNTSFDIPSIEFFELLYKAIDDDTPATGYTTVDKDPNNYFDVINIHPYFVDVTDNLTVDNWLPYIESFHNISVKYNDGGTEIWATEFGFVTNSDKECTTKMALTLKMVDSCEYLTRFYLYKVHDYSDNVSLNKWGLYDYDGYIKPLGEVVRDYLND